MKNTTMAVKTRHNTNLLMLPIHEKCLRLIQIQHCDLYLFQVILRMCKLTIDLNNLAKLILSWVNIRFSAIERNIVL